MLHIEVLENDTLYVEDSGKTFYYQLEPKDHVIINLMHGLISISKYSRLYYSHNEYWRVDITLHPAYVESRLYMGGGNDVFESAAKVDFLVIHRDGREILNIAGYEIFR